MTEFTVRFTIQAGDKKFTFTEHSEIFNTESLMNESIDKEAAEAFRTKLASWDRQVQTSAVQHLLRELLGQEQADTLKISFES